MKKIFKPILLLGATFFSYSSIFAAEVTEIRKKRKVVVINEGKSSGVTKGQEYCFNDTNGKKIGCGKVVKVMKSTASVRITNMKQLNKIQPGFTASSDASGGGKSSGGSSKFMAVRGLYLGGLTPYSYNKMAYVAPAATGTVETLWTADGTQSSNFVSFGGEIDLLSFGVAVGFKFRPITGFQTEEDFVQGNSNEYLINKLTGSNFGFYGDYYFIKTGSTTNGLRIGAGLDIDMSTINVTVSKTSEDGAVEDLDIYTASSKLTAISLRAPVSYDLTLGALGLNFGANLLIPLAGTAAASFVTEDSNITKYNDADNEAYAQTDFVTALGHKKNSFAFEVVIGAYVAF